MVSVTETAAQKIGEIKDAQNIQSAFVRLYVSGIGCGGPAFGMGFDNNEGENDLLEEESGIKFIMDQKLTKFLEGAVIDYMEQDGSSGFEIKTQNNNPGCSGNCSHCG
ncbi:MAG: iron-sulfur cluster assembly accessory protein [Peptococcaceae bacterium]|jgi:iron-sulfur cluster assembly protein|nr:iron-sulfur cluster assembly accessory protein [Peptococcaceae bacterium]